MHKLIPYNQNTQRILPEANVRIALLFYILPMLLLVIHHHNLKVGFKEGYGHILT